VLGLLVAIPTVLLHSIVNSKAKLVTTILEEQSTGIVAEQSSKAA
jgi:biopolymer transport protein ExbB